MPLSNSNNNSYNNLSPWSSFWNKSSSVWNDLGITLFSLVKKTSSSLYGYLTIATTQCEAAATTTGRSSSSSSSSSQSGGFLDWMTSTSSGNSSERTTHSSTSNSTTTDNNNSTTDNKNNDETTTSSGAATTLAEILLTLGFYIALGVLTQLVVRTLIGPSITSAADLENARDRPPASLVHRRIQRILAKRQEALHDRNSNGKDDQKKKAATATVTGAIVVPPMDSYELQMAEVILDPDDIECSFADIGGLDDAKREIYELAVLPLVQPDLFPSNSKLIRPVKGILLYGRPGTGKTMLAKALAKESAAVFIPLQLSKILNKWVGESNKLIAATFSLAHKLEPAIIFIDELDTFLKANSSVDSSSAYLDNIKSEFLTCWDGVATSPTSRVLVLGATNKPQAIDPAILRRMPRTFAVPLPDANGRLAILELLLADENLTDDARAYLPILARTETVGYSGSDLEELAKAAAYLVVQERTAEYSRHQVMRKERPAKKQQEQDQSAALDQKTKQPPRAISRQDLEIGLTKVQRTGVAARMYGREVAAEDEAEENANRPERNSNDDPSPSPPSPLDMSVVRTFAAFVRALSEFSTTANQSQQDPADDIPQTQ